MNYANIITCDIANGTGCRTSLFVSGCRLHCPGCFNEIAWDFNYGKPFTQEVMDRIIESLKPSHIHGLTILGGEPFDPKNVETVADIIKQVRHEFKDTKSIWIYTGYTVEQLAECIDPATAYALLHVDTIVDGPFDKTKAVPGLPFRGSTNQRILSYSDIVNIVNL